MTAAVTVRFTRQGQRNAAHGVPVDQIGSAVHRIQNPEAALRIQAAVVLLLPHKLYLRIQAGKLPIQIFLHPDIHLGHKIHLSFLMDLPGRF